jgi:hypothetical protein
MYSELIYTRCGEGIDILRGRTPIKNSGFKVFSCTDNITEDGVADLPFLYTVAQSKEPYADPGFMDDAYLFTVPDLGGKFLLNFHPIPFDKTATGDYSHRPGNFINQIFVGQFEDIYPYETFGNDAVWDAQKKGEAFYYENAPAPLAERNDLGETIGYITFDDIAAFVADGRREALMNAIAFIVSQYSVPAEERKFLVIRDENAKQIELWIAAIESAFSPRMASGLSFATRFDKFASTNKYTVNLSGQYQTQINLQSPNQKQRYRAMIVGVDERDRTNTAAARALANAPYAVLDGRTKTLSVSVDATNPYYRYVTSFNEGHEYLCREFFQTVDVSAPTGDVLKLFSAYTNLSKFSESKQLKDLLPALTILGQYRLIKSPVLEELYREIKQEIPGFLKADAVSAFTAMSWLESTAPVVGDSTVKECFHDIVCRSYADNLFLRPQSASAKELHRAVQKSAFAKGAVEYLVSPPVIAAYADAARTYSAEDWASFTELLADALKNRRECFGDAVRKFLPESAKALYRARDGQSAIEIASLYAAQDQGQTVDALLAEASTAADQSYIGFLIQLICRIAPEVISSENSLLGMYKRLQNCNLEKHFSDVLAYKAQNLTRTQEMEKFLDWILSCRELKEIDLSNTVKVLDQNLVLSDKNAGKLASKLQSCRPAGTACVNSAHLFVLDALDDKRLANKLTSLLSDAVSQGFPSLKNDAYADRLTGKVFDGKLPEEAFAAIATAAAKTPFYADRFAREAVRYIGTKQSRVMGDLIEIAAKTKSSALFDALVNACASVKQFDKEMTAVRETLRSKPAQQYFAQIEKDAKTLHNQKKTPSIFGRLFSRGASNGSDTGKKDNK